MSQEETVEERAKTLIAEVASYICSQEGPLTVEIDDYNHVYFEFAVEGKGGRMSCRYEPNIAAAELLKIWQDIVDKAAPSDIPLEQKKSETQRSAYVSLILLLGYIRPRFDEALDDLFHESLTHTSLLIHELREAKCIAQGVPIPNGDGKGPQELFARKQAEAVKQRIGARGRGAKRSFNISYLRSVTRELGHNANEKTVAHRMGVSTKTLQNYAKAQGFPNWKALMKSLMNEKSDSQKTEIIS